jgi:hypothetical protein
MPLSPKAKGQILLFGLASFAVFAVAVYLSKVLDGLFIFPLIAVLAFIICFVCIGAALGPQRSKEISLAVGRGLATCFNVSSRAVSTGADRVGGHVEGWVERMQMRREEERQRKELRRQEMIERRVAGIQPVQMASRSFGHDMV